MNVERLKYPRTYHLPFSKGVQDDDKYLKDFSLLEGQEVQVSIKMDGENSTLYHDGYNHARSIDSKTNWTRDIVKSIHSRIQYQIPQGHRLCCENLFARHSIIYNDGDLDGYLYLLSIWNDENVSLSLDETKVLAELFGLPMPKEIYRGVFDLKKFEKMANELDLEKNEGFVVRLVRPIHYDEFSRCMAKFVREGHVQSDQHWLKTAVKNGKPKSVF